MRLFKHELSYCSIPCALVAIFDFNCFYNIYTFSNFVCFSDIRSFANCVGVNVSNFIG